MHTQEEEEELPNHAGIWFCHVFVPIFNWSLLNDWQNRSFSGHKRFKIEHSTWTIIAMNTKS
jgi:hypothetical protein